MADYSLEQIKANPGADSSSTPLNIVSAARNGLCGLYRSKPWTIFGVPGPGEDTSPQSDSYRQVLDNLCDDQPLPDWSPPTPGGKCAIPYDVTFVFTGDPDSSPPFTTTDTRRVTGPIGSIQMRTNPANPASWQYYFTAGVSGSIINVGQFLKAESNASSFKAYINSVVAVNPALDICGSRLPSFPPGVGGGQDYNPPVTYRDRGVSIPVNVNIPPIIIPPGAVQVKPSFEVKIGPNKIVFDLSGGKLSIEPSLNVPITIGGGGTTPNPNTPVAPEIDGEAIADRFDRVEELIDRLKKCVCDPYPPFDNEQLFSNVQSGCYTLLPKDRNKFCAINITQSPTNPKSQPGGSAPDVLYCGWAWFHTGAGQASERFPVDAFGKIYPNEGRYGVFCFTLYEGYRADVYGLHVPLDYYNSIHDD